MSLVNGVVNAEVVRVDDPDGEGKVLIRFPRLPGKNQGYWAPVASLMSGNGRGAWFMPEKGDEVLVAFDNGSVEHPYIVGFLWNGTDKPPVTDPHQRVIKSVKGHTITLDDNDNGERIEVKSKGGHTMTFDDKGGSEKVELRSNGGLRITLDDTGAKKIAIEGGGRKIEMSQGQVNFS